MDYNRLKWACRRGMLELDLILLPFVENHYQSLDASEQALFDQLLESEDQDLFNWFLQRHQPEDETMRHIIATVRDMNSRTPIT